MSDEQAEAHARARAWCEARGARVRWDEDEERCRIRVAGPDGEEVEGQGATFYEAYVEARLRHEARAPGGPPASF